MVPEPVMVPGPDATQETVVTWYHNLAITLDGSNVAVCPFVDLGMTIGKAHTCAVAVPA